MTQPTFFVEEDKILTSLFEEGLDNLHLYKPGASPMYSERLLTLLADSFYPKISVHDNFYLKEEYHLHGIHISDPETPVPNGYRGHVSRTCTDLSLLKKAKKNAEKNDIEESAVSDIPEGSMTYTEEVESLFNWSF
jgi:thiamine-phosphate pyrophosphorylase